MQANVSFDLVYNAPDGSVGMWPREGFEASEDDYAGEDDKHLLADDEVSMHSSKSASRHSLSSHAANSSRRA